MAGNFRIFYPLQSIAIGAPSTASGVVIHGLQSAGLTTSFNLQNVMELGQLEIYENLEDIPSVELSLSKALDSKTLIYHACSPAATDRTLLTRTRNPCDVFMNLFSDLQNNASGMPLTQVYCSGMFINSVSYSLPVDTHFTENVTLVGADKLWRNSSFVNFSGFDGTDVPTSHIQRRNNVVMGAAPTGSIFPSEIPGMNVVGGSGYVIETAGVFGAHVQNINISCNLGRTNLFEQGRRRYYYKYANFPTQVTCSIGFTNGGTTPNDNINASGDAIFNVTNQPILIKLSDGTQFDLGAKNKLQNVSMTGGDTGGGVMSTTYDYINYNKLDVVLTSTDPAGL